MMKVSEKKILLNLDKVIIAALFVFVAFSMFSISITQIAAGLGGLAWVARTHLTSAWKDQQWPLVIPILLFILACLVAVADAHDVSYSVKPLKKLIEIVIFFWAVNCIREDRLRDSLSLLLIIAAALAGILGFYQAWINGITLQTRVEGTFSVYMTFAGLLMIVGMSALGRALFKSPRETVLWLPISIIATCLLFTLTRQAWLGSMIGLLFLVYIRKKLLLLILPFILAFVVWVSPAEVKNRLENMVSGKDFTFSQRFALWQGGWEIFKDHPLTGCGFRCVDLINSQYPDPTGFIKQLRGMHSNFVQLAVDTGILGLTTWLGIWFCFFRLLYQRSAALKHDPLSCWVIFGSSAAGIAFLVGGFFESNFYDSEVVMVLYFLMALPFSGSQNNEKFVIRNVNKPTHPGI